MRDLIDINNKAAQQAVLSARQSNPRWNPATATNHLPEGWQEFIIHHAACLASLQDGRSAEAYDRAITALPFFIKIFREDPDSWVVAPMHSVVHNIRIIADSADAELKAAGRQAGKLADAGDQLRKCFSVSLQAPGNRDKKLAALNVVNLSIKIYFKLNTLRLCKNLIRTVESRQFAEFTVFPAAQRVTYQFYKGRLAVFDENYEEAAEALSYALKHCHRSAAANRARILKYLLPVELLLGKLPSPALMHMYTESLGQYAPLIAAIKTGDVAGFNTVMEEQQFRFIAEGTYLLLEKLRQTCYRRLFKLVAIVHAENDPAKASQIPLSLFQLALAMQGIEMGMDEVECVIANLIYRKYIRGYLSHQHKVAVVAKASPFPPLNTIEYGET